MIRKRVKRSRDGSFELRLPTQERDLLRTIGPQMRTVLTERGEWDDAVDRLFPVAYPTDEDRQTEYRLLVHDELLASHLGAITVLVETADADRLTQDQLSAWMRAVNEIRLVMGTRLGVTDEGDERPHDAKDPRCDAYGVYDYLSFLQGEIIQALSAAEDFT